MAKARLTDEEQQRLFELERYDILDSPPEEVFDRLVEMTREYLAIASVALCFIDESRQWIKACQGVADELEQLRELPREASLSNLLLQSTKPLAISDASFDQRVNSSFLVRKFGARALAAAPLLTSKGRVIGVLYVWGPESRVFSPRDQRFLETMARAAMAEIDLRRQSELAHLTSVDKNAFIANLSREMRVPMATILGHLDLFADSPLHTEETHEWLETVNQTARHLVGLISDALDLSKIEIGRLTLRNDAVNITELVNDVLATLRARADAKHLQLLLMVDGLIPENIQGDPVRIRQVILNLVGNAIRFTTAGHVTLSLSFLEQVLVLKVSDTGRGIPRESLSTVFEPFIHQTDQSLSDYVGNGLRLAITQRLVGAMGGTLQVHSTLGVGTEFVMRLPLKRAGE